MAADAFIGSTAALLGLVVGSFLNVVIHRLPRMMEAQWAKTHEQACDHAKQPMAQSYNIVTPGSHCPHCGHALPWLEKIPVLSYLWLRGRCRHCEAAIGWRYPVVELLTGALFVWGYQRYGLSAQALAWSGFAAALVTLAAIDADTTLLPDVITQPLVWSGLLVASLNLGTVDLSTALWGAVVGYLFLWSVNGLFKGVTGKEGMGQGDFKLLAALGAWLGWPALLSVVLIASITGVAVGLCLRAHQRLAEDGYIPFGPYLAFAGLWVMALGPLPVLPA